ncbi:MAG TPA: hypothetical protein VNE82_19165 [Candidatus Binataceae bacterium]|nr:hypothetical protein [Candidatus Binataceae bacterium]
MQRAGDGLSTLTTRNPNLMDANSKQTVEKVERLAVTLISMPFATAACTRQRVDVVERVGEDTVIDSLQRSLKQKRSHVHKLVIFFMNRENQNNRATASWEPDFHRSRSMALGAVVWT